MARVMERPFKYLVKNTRPSFWVCRSSEIFSNADFSSRYLRGPRSNIFSAATQETTARAMFV